MLNFECWIWILDLNIEFEYWIWILNLSIEFECLIWVLNLNIEFEYWILNVKVKCYWGWVWSERLCIYFQVADIGYFCLRRRADTYGLRKGCFGCSWLLRPSDGGTIPSSRSNGIKKVQGEWGVVSWNTDNWLVKVSISIEYICICKEVGWVGREHVGYRRCWFPCIVNTCAITATTGWICRSYICRLYVLRGRQISTCRLEGWKSSEVGWCLGQPK